MLTYRYAQLYKRIYKFNIFSMHLFDGPVNIRHQTTRIYQEHNGMAPTDEGIHDGRGCYPGCGPRPEGMEKKDKAVP